MIPKAPKTAVATYVYGLAHGSGPPSLAKAPRGLPGVRRCRALDAGGGLWLIVAEAPLSRFGAKTLERSLHDLEWLSACAVGHDAVIAHVARTASVLPMKLFTLFSSDERALAQIRARRRKLDRLLARLAGRREWGVRLSLGHARMRADRRPSPVGRGGAGTRFLLRKQAEAEVALRLRERGRVEARRVFQDLRRRAADARRRPIVHTEAGPRVLLDAAFLVPTSAAGRFKAAVRAAAARAARAGYDVTLTGPWPPYTFATERL